MQNLIAEMNRLNGVLGKDPWISDVVATANSGHGDEAALRAQCQSKRTDAEAEYATAISVIPRDAEGNGSVLSITEAAQEAVELALHRLMRVEAACKLIDSVWPPTGTTEEEAKEGARNALANGHGGVKNGCTAKCAAKKAELLGGGEKLIAEGADDY